MTSDDSKPQTAHTSANGLASAPAATAPATAEEIARVAEMSRRVAEGFGKIVAVLMRSQQFRHAFLADLEWLVLPAIATGQFALAEAHQKESGIAAPVALVLWATVADEVDARLTANMGQSMRLRPSEWASGQNPWLVEAIGDARAVKALIDQLLAGKLKGRNLKVVSRGADGRATLQVMHASEGGAATGAASAG